MSEVEVLDVMYQMFQTVLKLALPLLLVSMIIGIIIAIFQAATQINEQTMTFVPKLLAIIALLGLLGSSMLKTLQDFLQTMIGLIAGG
ncbi:MAG: flagellar type III secretion system protein FliQ [Lachnospiraceae bacterium]|nr:flagellar type III secretion system protein FliQ [Lachnospiraceae bacterium]